MEFCSEVYRIGEEAKKNKFCSRLFLSLEASAMLTAEFEYVYLDGTILLRFFFKCNKRHKELDSQCLDSCSQTIAEKR